MLTNYLVDGHPQYFVLLFLNNDLEQDVAPNIDTISKANANRVKRIFINGRL